MDLDLYFDRAAEMALSMSKPKPAPSSPAVAATQDPYGGALEQTMVSNLTYDVLDPWHILHNV